jgi:alanyl-tRNA synthetase
VEDIVNEQIKKALPVCRNEMSVEQARQKGSMALFSDKYSDNVSVYSAGDFSSEVCAGPHVENTSKIGEGSKVFKIKKEEAVAAGVRRIKAVLE